MLKTLFERRKDEIDYLMDQRKHLKNNLKQPLEYRLSDISLIGRTAQRYGMTDLFEASYDVLTQFYVRE
jgi:2-hydroxychromene-2-carboxylate isomerase